MYLYILDKLKSDYMLNIHVFNNIIIIELAIVKTYNLQEV